MIQGVGLRLPVVLGSFVHPSEKANRASNGNWGFQGFGRDSSNFILR